MKERYIQINVDVQNDFCPGGALAVNEGDNVVKPLNNLSEAVRTTDDGLVIFTRDAHPVHTEHFDKWPVHCVRGTHGSLLHEELDFKPKIDQQIFKGTGTVDDGYSGFEGKTLDGRDIKDIIGENNKRTILMIGGLATDFCVKATVVDALDFAQQQKAKGRQVLTYLLTDAIKAVNLQPGDDKRAIDEMLEAGVILTTTEEMIKTIKARG